MYILGISAFYHDSAACLLKEDEIIAAAQEERFTRLKNEECFPAHAVRYCLEEAGVTLAEVSYVVYYEKPFLKFERLIESYVASSPYGFLSFLKAMSRWLRGKLFLKRIINNELLRIGSGWRKQDKRLLFAGHHQSHAASAFYPSPFSKALILSIDGVGEWTTTSVWMGEGNKLSLLNEIKFPHSIGLLYASFTAYLGFKVNCDEYKVMGLAPYGKPKYADLIFKEIIDLKADGSFKLNRRYLDYEAGLSMVSKNFCLLFGSSPRSSSDEITEFHMDIAASVQYVTEKVLLAMVTCAVNKYAVYDLCLAGGVALNCVANGRILKETKVKNLWIQPAAGDAGGALGAAYCAYYDFLNHNRPDSATGEDKMKLSLLGPCFKTADVEVVLKNNKLRYHIFERCNFLTKVAGYIDAGKVIGWFDGRMEFGPRALGSRSILGDCRRQDMQSHINHKVKFRESFRPFAPAILAEQTSDYYELRQSSPYMLITSTIKGVFESREVREAVGFDKLNFAAGPFPAVTHVDGSSRLQTVTPKHSSFYDLIHTFYRMTGCPAIVNTSFNVRDEPVVCTPQDAVDCFLKTNIDILAMENCIVIKAENSLFRSSG